MLGQGVAKAVNVKWQHRQAQFAGGKEGAPVETLDRAVLATRSLRENDDGISPGNEALHVLHVLLQSVRDGIELRLPDQVTIERAVQTHSFLRRITFGCKARTARMSKCD